LRIEKKGDYNIKCSEFSNKYIIYSDSKDTQIFEFDPHHLNLKKLTSKICTTNGLQALPSAQWMTVVFDE
jgi:hypothetical protein